MPGAPYLLLDMRLLDWITLCNSVAEVIGRVAEITQTQPCFVEGDVRDAALLGRLFSEHKIDSVIHFSALKSVGESVENPLAYYDTNFKRAVDAE